MTNPSGAIIVDSGLALHNRSLPIQEVAHFSLRTAHRCVSMRRKWRIFYFAPQALIEPPPHQARINLIGNLSRS
jgi:hypothetical protein